MRYVAMSFLLAACTTTTTSPPSSSSSSSSGGPSIANGIDPECAAKFSPDYTWTLQDRRLDDAGGLCADAKPAYDSVVTIDVSAGTWTETDTADNKTTTLPLKINLDENNNRCRVATSSEKQSSVGSVVFTRDLFLPLDATVGIMGGTSRILIGAGADGCTITYKTNAAIIQ